MPKSNFESDLDDLVKKMDTVKDGIDSFEKDFEKKRTEYTKVLGTMWDAKDAIDKAQKDLKKGPDAKKTKDLADSIEENEKALKKAEKTIGGLTSELSFVGSGANTTLRVIKEQDKELDKLEKDLLRTGCDEKQLKDWSNTIKALRKSITAESARAQSIVDEVKGLPKPPKL